MSRSWTFTLNNYTEDECEFLSDRFIHLCTTLLVSKEVGASGTPHLQGYFSLKRTSRLAALKKKIPRAHFEIARGDRNDNRAYIFKPGSEQFINKDNGGRGKRNDITDFIDQAKESGLKRAVIDDVSTYVKYHKGLEKALSVIKDPGPREEYPTVYWAYGPPGIGKTTMYRHSLGIDRSDCYQHNGDPNWWDGYDYQTCVVINEFDKPNPVNAKNWTIGHFLQLVSDEQYYVPIKGGFRNFNSPIVVFTSTAHPRHIFPNDVDFAQVRRRITHIITRESMEEDWVQE